MNLLTHQLQHSMWTLQQEAGTGQSVCLYGGAGEEAGNTNVPQLLPETGDVWAELTRAIGGSSNL
jgi:hypothetical protein